MENREHLVHFPISGYKAAVRLYPSERKSAPTVIALHGFTGSGMDFEQLRKALGLANANWICPDFMGHGASDSPTLFDPYSLQRAIQLIDCCRELAPDPQKVRILGYSMGGRIALHYIYRKSALPCTLISASPGIEKREARSERQDHDRQLADLLLTQGIEAFCDLWEKQPLIQPQTQLDPSIANEVAKRRRENNPIGLAHSLLAVGAGFIPHLWDKIAGLHPIQVVYGEEDARFAEISKSMRSRNRGFTLTRIPGCGHAPHLESPELLAACVRKHLL